MPEDTFPSRAATSAEPVVPPAADPPTNLEAWARASLRHMWPGEDDDDPRLIRGVE